VETCDVVESALAKKLISPPPNELLSADISNETVSIFRFKGTRDRSENLVTPSAPCADEVSPLRSRIGICEHIRNNLCEMNTYTKKGEGCILQTRLSALDFITIVAAPTRILIERRRESL
jgi:hypothetical protein